MILADKIIELRKKSGMTQDELAEKLGVSRQSVSKWESAQSTPDLGRILKMSEIFSVSTDVLLKDELSLDSSSSSDSTADKSHVVETEPPLRPVSMEEASEFLEKNRKKSFLNALGVGICIISFIFPILFDAMFGDSPIANAGAVLWLVFVAIAVGIFVYSGGIMKKFAYLHSEHIDTEYGVDGMVKDKRNRTQSSNLMCTIIGVMLCIISPLATIITEVLNVRELENYFAALMILIIAVGVFLIVYSANIKGGYNVLLEEGSYSRVEKTDRKNLGAVMAVYWSLATAIYLAYSFITFDWGRSWIVWPVAGVLCPVVCIIARKFVK